MPSTSPAINGESDQETAALLREVATPDLYRRNSFRVLELPVDATQKEVTRRKQMVEMAAANGVALPAGPGRSFPLEPAPDEFTIRDAVQRLGDPERRLVDEFFWFWPQEPGQSKSDPGLQHLNQGNHERASEVWSQQEANHGDHVATHNLAVLNHLLALQRENLPRPSEVTGDERKGIEQLWSRAFRRWQALIDEEGFWSRLTTRVCELDDPRLTAGTARRLRAALPAVLLSINARLALQAVELDKKDSATRLVGLIRRSGFPEDTIQDGLRQALESVHARIKALCKATQNSAETDPSHADNACRHFLDSAVPLLTGLDCLLAAGDTSREVAHDEIAEQALQCLVAFASKAQNWQRAIAIIEVAAPLAASPSVAKNFQEHLKDFRENAEETNWWCAAGYWDCSPNELTILETARRNVGSIRENDAIYTVAGLIRRSLAGEIAAEQRSIFERCLAYAFNERCIRLDREAWTVFNADPPAFQRVKNKLSETDPDQLSESIPDIADTPNSPIRLKCVSCRGAIQGSYVQRQFGNLHFAFCTACNADLNREFKEQERIRNAALGGLVEMMMLAVELNPKSKQLRLNLDGFQEQARKHSLPIPASTLSLRRKLGIVPFDELQRELIRAGESEQRGLWPEIQRSNPARAREFREQLFKSALEMIVAAKSRDRDAMRCAREFLQNGGSVLIQSVVEEALAPMLARLHKYCAEAKRAMGMNFQRGCEIIQTLTEKARPDLATVEFGFGKSDRSLQLLGDIVVQTAIAISRDFASKTEQWVRIVKTLEKLLPLPCVAATEKLLKDELAKAGVFAAETNSWRHENYFNLPIDLYKQLEAAHSQVREQKWNQAIEALVDLLLGKAGIPPTDDHKASIEQTLAFALHGRCSTTSFFSKELPAGEQVLEDALLALELNPRSKMIAATIDRIKTAATDGHAPFPESGVNARIRLRLATVPDLLKATKGANRRIRTVAWDALERDYPQAAQMARYQRMLKWASVIGGILMASILIIYDVINSMK